MRLRLKRRVGPSLRGGPRVARRRGLTYRPADDTHLLVDLDTEHQCKQFDWMLPIIRRFLWVEVEKVTVSKSAADEWHRHVYLKLPHALTDAERIALQGILGSDPMREWLSLVRVWGGVKDPIQLFESSDAE